MQTKTMDMKTLMFGLLAAAALAMPSSKALANETPATLAGTTLVSAEKVKELYDRGVPMIDARVANEYAEAHIKGAINIPYKEKSGKVANFDPSGDSFDMSKLPADKNAPVVVYCNAGTCWKSFKASTVMLKAGYKKIFWFREGFPAWKAKGYPVE